MSNARHKVADAQGLGRAIAALRAERGWTQRELADWSGLNRTYLSSLESGEPTLALQRLFTTISTLGYEISLTPRSGTDERDDW